MYSSEYEDNQNDYDSKTTNNNSSGGFYQNNKILVWIFIAVILVAIIIIALKKSGNDTSTSKNTNTDKATLSIYPENDVIISPGGNYKLFAVANNNDSGIKYIWTSSDEKIATVSDGTVTAIKYGTVTITATYTSNNTPYTATKSITIADGKRDVALTDATIKAGDLLMPPTGTYTIDLTITPTDAYIFDRKYTSSDENIATVDDLGVIKAVGEGEAVITISINEGAKTLSLKVLVNKDYTNTEIAVNPSKITLNKDVTKMKVGDKAQIGYIIEPTEAIRSVISWSSSDDSILKVDNSGNVEAIKEGKAAIKVATANGISDSIEIEVEPNVMTVTDITPSETEVYLEIDQTETITATITPEEATDKTFTCSTSSEKIAKVSSGSDKLTCKIEGVAEGNAIVTIKANGGDASNTIKVVVSKPSSGGSSGGGSGSAKCKTTCASGKYCSNGKCVSCTGGYYCSGGKRIACPAGTGSVANSTAPKDCEPCAKGYYSTGNGKGCIACPSGKTTKSAGSTSKDACNVDASTVCSAGYYRSGSDCKKCPTGYFSNSGSTSISNCYKTVFAGYGYKNNGTYQCEKGTYSIARTVYYNKNSTCTKCPDHYTTSTTESKSRNDCNVVVYTNVGYCTDHPNLNRYEKCTVPSGYKCGSGSAQTIQCTNYARCTVSCTRLTT